MHKLFSDCRYPVSRDRLCEELECGTATVKRLIREMREQLNAPIICKTGQGYCYAKNSTFELPGVWFSADEMYALLTMQQLTQRISGHFMEAPMGTLRSRIEKILAVSTGGCSREFERIRVLGAGSRGKPMPLFPLIAGAVLQRNRISIVYDGRQRGVATARTVSPQRLAWYRGNWYLDAWCHKADALRTFSLDRISNATFADGACLQLDGALLDQQLASSFGIFAGEPVATAVLRFTPQAARWVADEEWFPDASGEWLADGRYEMRIPYSNPTELILEICRHGPDVEVIEPQTLRQAVASRLADAAAQYTHGITI
ncbi:MAG: WYL domain-containing transcriptional regulator [Mariprofundus sp.]